MQPLVSVVMPSLNQAEFIVSAVQSVLSQSYGHLELIVADGGSTDGTLALLQQQQGLDSRLRWMSEPDTGPADALNKALRRARGTIVGWLNSDDLYAEGAIDRAVQALGNRLDPPPTREGWRLSRRVPRASLHELN
jgi:glycosyltransferase involved in cell wall biosynthesis